jgi:putative nucleotidyltransferase with HDIG domain
MPITRDEAVTLLKEYVKNERMLAHCYASEQVMRSLARRLGRDEEKWGLAGLLHDIDVELVDADLNIHGMEAKRILSERGLDPEIVDAVFMHNEVVSKRQRETEFHHALAAGETITGLIIATALVYPDRKIASVKPKSVTKRMKEKAFAASVSRENIMECEAIGLPLDEFAAICLDAMKEIGHQIGL